MMTRNRCAAAPRLHRRQAVGTITCVLGEEVIAAATEFLG
jgi:hypothetical protein